MPTMGSLVGYLPTAVKYLAESGSAIPTLLTGGGFVFLAAVMTGLFMWNKNSADGAAALAKGSTELTEGIRKEITAIKDDRDEVRKQCRACEDRLNIVEQKWQTAEDDTRRVKAALRAVIRVVDSKDQAAIDEAIEAARALT